MSCVLILVSRCLSVLSPLCAPSSIVCRMLNLLWAMRLSCVTLVLSAAWKVPCRLLEVGLVLGGSSVARCRVRLLSLCRLSTVRILA